MTKNRKDHTTRTLATMVRILDDPAATPEQVRIAMGWGAIPPGSARVWLAGYLTGVRAAPSASNPVKLLDEA